MQGQSLRIKKFSTFRRFKELVAGQLKVPEARQLWLRLTKEGGLEGSYIPATVFGRECDEQAMCLFHNGGDGLLFRKDWTTNLYLLLVVSF